ncbi:MAG TPA: glycosyltransferase family 39 protein [Vicinamibacterales bacterium]|nr:glycosyltransferase family 39 protein [Vicinamibacterales bacterium]
MASAKPLAQDRVAAFVTIGLTVLAGLAILLRIPSISEPLGIDQSLWASAVRGMARGQLLYADVWEQRPPGIYLTYLAAFSVFGWTPAAVGWLDVLASAVVTALLYVLARTLAGPRTGAAAAALYAVLTMPAWLYKYGGFLERSVCETFIAVCVGFAAFCALGVQRRQSLLMAFGLGLWAGAAIVFKPNAGIYLPALLLWTFVGFPGAARPPKGFMLRVVAVAALGAVVLPALAFVWLWQQGLLTEARTAILDFNRWYVGNGFTLTAYAAKFYDRLGLHIKTEPLWLAGVIAAAVAIWDLARTRRLPPLAMLAVLWGGAAAIAITVNGMGLFNSYFINPLAPLALLVAWWLSDRSAASIMSRSLAVVTAILMVTLLVQRNFLPKIIDWTTADAAMLRGGADRTAYLDRFGGYGREGGYSARANEELADYVRAHTQPADRVYLFGINGAGLYFLSDRLTAHRFLRVNFYVPDAFPDPRFTLGGVVEDLRARQPAYLIFERLHSETEMGRAVDALPENPLIRSLLESYALDRQIEDFTLYRRR